MWKENEAQRSLVTWPGSHIFQKKAQQGLELGFGPWTQAPAPLAVWSLRQVMGVSLVIRSPAHETSRQKKQHWMQEGQLALSHLTAGKTEAQKGEVTQVTQSRKE